MEAGIAFARFVRSLSSSLEQLADDILAEVAQKEPVLLPGPVDGAEPEGLGKRQHAIFELGGMQQEAGMRASDIAAAIDYQVPNTNSTLQAMERAGYAERIPGKVPTHWRLTPRYRSTADPYLRAASHVRKGEWTTYGDISIAVRRDTLGARAVGRAAARLETFPNPHRVLQAGGRIPDGWKDDQGGGPDECRRRLQEEDVNFISGRADPTRRIAWDVLVERQQGEPS